MNIIEFTNCLHHPKEISNDQVVGLEGILEEYPYFQAVHFLYLNGLKNQNSFKYNNILKRTAAYTTDRTVLFDHISSLDYNYKPVSESVVSDHEIEIINDTDQESTFISSESDKKSTDPKPLPLGKPLQFDASEDFSFNEWLQISSIKPIQRTIHSELKKEDPRDKILNPDQSAVGNFDLIDKFIAANPKINPHDSFDNSNISTESIIENKNLMTETLAHVYLEQKKYQKAITAFTVLSLKYPEKSSFFANRIKEINKLQEK